ncbi:MAG TPA: hypothetical protein VFM34_00230 [Moraxellaceae bacterium]|nr:hypothetical protein [Moraxellaceae bacterium]
MTDSAPSNFDLALEGFRLGDSETFLRLDGPDQFARATHALVSQTRRELCILSPDFEPDRYNNDDFADQLSAFARRSRYSDARILIGDPTIAVRWGHKVVALARRMPSRLRIRQLAEEDVEPQESWMVADDISLLRRDSMDGFAGSLSARAIPHAQRASNRFTELWERSHEVQDFRILDL